MPYGACWIVTPCFLKAQQHLRQRRKSQIERDCGLQRRKNYLVAATDFRLNILVKPQPMMGVLKRASQAPQAVSHFPRICSLVKEYILEVAVGWSRVFRFFSPPGQKNASLECASLLVSCALCRKKRELFCLEINQLTDHVFQ